MVRQTAASHLALGQHFCSFITFLDCKYVITDGFMFLLFYLLLFFRNRTANQNQNWREVRLLFVRNWGQISARSVKGFWGKSHFRYPKWVFSRIRLLAPGSLTLGSVPNFHLPLLLFCCHLLLLSLHYYKMTFRDDICSDVLFVNALSYRVAHSLLLLNVCSSVVVKQRISGLADNYSFYSAASSCYCCCCYWSVLNRKIELNCSHWVTAHLVNFCSALQIFVHAVFCYYL